jgi:hypothetical protein
MFALFVCSVYTFGVALPKSAKTNHFAIGYSIILNQNLWFKSRQTKEIKMWANFKVVPSIDNENEVYFVYYVFLLQANYLS